VVRVLARELDKVTSHLAQLMRPQVQAGWELGEWMARLGIRGGRDAKLENLILDRASAVSEHVHRVVESQLSALPTDTLPYEDWVDQFLSWQHGIRQALLDTAPPAICSSYVGAFSLLLACSLLISDASSTPVDWKNNAIRGMNDAELSESLCKATKALLEHWITHPDAARVLVIDYVQRGVRGSSESRDSDG
jgi:hypothetical protein